MEDAFRCLRALYTVTLWLGGLGIETSLRRQCSEKNAWNVDSVIGFCMDKTQGGRLQGGGGGAIFGTKGCCVRPVTTPGCTPHTHTPFCCAGFATKVVVVRGRLPKSKSGVVAPTAFGGLACFDVDRKARKRQTAE